MEYAHHHLKMKNLLSIQIFYGKKIEQHGFARWFEVLRVMVIILDTFTHNTVQGYAV